MDRSLLALLLGLLLLANPLYVDAFVPGPTYDYQVHALDPESIDGSPTLAILGYKTMDPTYRGPTADVVTEHDDRELAVIRQATGDGYEASVNDVPGAAENLANDAFVVAEVRTDEWRAFAVTHETTDDTFSLRLDRISAQSFVDALAVPVADAPPRVRELVRGGHLETRRPVRSVVFVDDGRYYSLDRDGADPYTGPLRLLPWLLGVVGAGLVVSWLYRHAKTGQAVGTTGR